MSTMRINDTRSYFRLSSGYCYFSIRFPRERPLFFLPPPPYSSFQIESHRSLQFNPFQEDLNENDGESKRFPRSSKVTILWTKWRRRRPFVSFSSTSSSFHRWMTFYLVSYLWFLPCSWWTRRLCGLTRFLRETFLQSSKARIKQANIIKDVDSGWSIRLVHTNGACFYFLLTYIHIRRNLFHHSFKLNYVWLIGWIILFLSIATAFLGYVLPWGQISFWGAIVITNLLSALPYIGTNNCWSSMRRIFN